MYFLNIFIVMFVLDEKLVFHAKHSGHFICICEQCQNNLFFFNMTCQQNIFIMHKLVLYVYMSALELRCHGHHFI